MREIKKQNLQEKKISKEISTPGSKSQDSGVEDIQYKRPSAPSSTPSPSSTPTKEDSQIDDQQPQEQPNTQEPEQQEPEQQKSQQQDDQKDQDKSDEKKKDKKKDKKDDKKNDKKDNRNKKREDLDKKGKKKPGKKDPSSKSKPKSPKPQPGTQAGKQAAKEGAKAAGKSAATSAGTGATASAGGTAAGGAAAATGAGGAAAAGGGAAAAGAGGAAAATTGGGVIAGIVAAIGWPALIVIAVIIIILLVLIVFIFFMSMGGDGSSGAHTPTNIERSVEPTKPVAGKPANAKSLNNPRNWYFNQGEYSADIAEAGCYCTSLTMALNFMGKDVDPTYVCNITGIEVHAQEISSTYPDIIVQENQYVYDFDKQISTIKKYLDKEIPVILGGGYPLSSGGPTHYVVAVGYNSEGVTINDPGNRTKTKISWEDLQAGEYGQTAYGYTSSDYGTGYSSTILYFANTE